ncbi:MAG: 16S rRNA (cytosine(1402)-N(4))-methyltransferase RsmH [Ferrovibrio sp.]|uniref:16S rRNA (cytosine(1402)-N(4))-methyltransferase RsmH n=1 Tax=Ferrovibrio sp. TaxID=1917215 RepID=UPI0026120A1A|nr:16S rRNA (cytosine(1402)-N(4))-methyltransferase RsmH [Ferrovibrio sp.]MCW0233304.1 16S rRNA (cytosine(1402)-N(4))-methyltransferase RsmH [Ferrovibrio sp.]
MMCSEVVAALNPRAGDVMVDGTFGAGGYSSALLAAAECRVIGIDRDPTVQVHADRVSAAYPGRFRLLAGRFGDMADLLGAIGIDGVDGVALDIGVSSMQIDQAERGFSFQQDGPLDMRMSDKGETAADIVNSRDEAELADIIYLYGEERRARAVARAIVAARAEAPITRTRQLAQIVARVVRAAPGINPATRTFQALRIVVNDELGELKRGLVAAEKLLKPEGRLAVVSFHSLEDRVVKHFLDRRSGKQTGSSRHLPQAATAPRAASFELLHKGALTAGEVETAGNPRARSAKLRAARRTAAPVWPDDDMREAA